MFEINFRTKLYVWNQFETYWKPVARVFLLLSRVLGYTTDPNITKRNPERQWGLIGKKKQTQNSTRQPNATLYSSWTPLQEFSPWLFCFLFWWPIGTSLTLYYFSFFKTKVLNNCRRQNVSLAKDDFRYGFFFVVKTELLRLKNSVPAREEVQPIERLRRLCSTYWRITREIRLSCQIFHLDRNTSKHAEPEETVDAGYGLRVHEEILNRPTWIVKRAKTLVITIRQR